jgi:hypothetical protein
MRETLHPASLANPEKAELPPSTQRQMGWRGEVMNPKIFISSDPLAMPPARRRIGCLAPCHPRPRLQRRIVKCTHKPITDKGKFCNCCPAQES